ncbi:MAG: single-stranded DNA-binding protein [Leptospiraceae bacterium]|nr:MAG: single-stranded DNA-binding protein [Leptospiraceae bacterium]
MSLAFTILEGNLIKDPEMRTVGDNQKVTIMVLAVNHGKNKENVSFFTIETWGKNAENCKNYLKKGSKIRVMGDLRQDRWIDDKGSVHSKIKIVSNQVAFLKTKKKKLTKQDAA